MTDLDHRERYVVEAERFCEVVPNGDALMFVDTGKPEAYILCDSATLTGVEQ